MRLLSALALAALPLGVALTTAASVPAPTTTYADDEDVLQESMAVLQKNQRALKKLISDPAANEDKLLEILGSMEEAVRAAMGEPSPAAPEGVEGKDASLFGLGYKRTLVSLLDSTLKMQESTLKGEAEELAADYKVLSGLKDSGHTNYRDGKGDW